MASLKRRTPSAATLLAAGMRVDDQRVARGDHAHRVAGDGGQRVRDGRDRGDDAEGGVLDDRQAVVAAEDLAAEELHARRPLAERLELLDLVQQAADLGLFHLHRAQLDALLDGDAADVADDAAAVVDGHAGEPLEGLAGGGHGAVDVAELPETALITAVGRRRGRAAHPRQDLLDHAANQVLLVLIWTIDSGFVR